MMVQLILANPYLIQLVHFGFMKITSIQGRMGLLFLAFFLLVSVSAGVTFWGIDTQKEDALVVNLAGRQRMLVQQMARLALEIGQQRSQDSIADLERTAAAFEETLNSLRYGGQAPYLTNQMVELPPTRDAALLAHLDQVAAIWEPYRASLQVILVGEAGSLAFRTALETVEQLSPALVDQADQVVRLYEGAAQDKVARLRWVQIGFFAGALALLATGSLIIRDAILFPLEELGRAAETIGKGNLETPVEVGGPDEINLLAGIVESMRAQLRSSQQELLSWADTLEERVARRTFELEALYQVSREISSPLEIEHVLHSVTDKARELLRAEIALLCLLDNENRLLTLHSVSGARQAVARSSSPVAEALPSRVLASWRAMPCGVSGCSGTCGIIAEPYRTSHLAASLRMGDRVIGALCVGSSEKGIFDLEAENLLTKLANSAAIALENARLYSQAERLGVLEERQRLAAEMHDGLAQTMSYLRLKVDQARGLIEQGQEEMAAKLLAQVEQTLGRGIEEIRRSISSLQENIPLHFTLQEQLERLVDELDAPGKVNWESHVHTPLVLPPQEVEQVLRVAREALLNACRHGRAQRITVILKQVVEAASVTIQDDGRGFEPSAEPGDGDQLHFGIKVMRARAARLGGRLEINSAPGTGTQVVLTWPLKERIQDEAH